MKEIRQSKGLTMRQVADKAGVTEAYISFLEAGKRKNPSMSTLIRIAEALGVPLGDLFEEPRAKTRRRERRTKAKQRGK